MPLIGRLYEQEKFAQLEISSQSEFIAVYGRRRTGKTFLIKEYFKDRICFHLTGVQDAKKADQLQTFAQEISFKTKSFIPPPKNWIEAFAILKNYLISLKKTKHKKVIFIDELPWLDTKKSGCLQALAHFWNNWAAWEKDIILVVCGSATSWIINNIINDKKGLHNRVTYKIHLQPFTLAETEQFLKYRKVVPTRYQICILYMALGGIPFYLNEIQSSESADQNIHRICFQKSGALRNEFDNLYKALFDSEENYVKIAKALAGKTSGLNRTSLLKAAKLPNAGSSTRIINDLILNGFIDYLPDFSKEKNSGTYVLTDFYTRFYFSFMDKDKTENWMNFLQTGKWYNWADISFEQVCLQHQDEIKKALGISAVATSTNMIRSSDAQIDLLISRKDNVIHLCEIKFLENEFDLTKKIADNIRNKVAVLRSKITGRRAIFPTMITTYGCKKNKYYLDLIQNEVTLDHLFEKR